MIIIGSEYAYKPHTSVMKNTGSDFSKTSNTKKKGFRIKRNKTLKKRLFSANPRDEITNPDYNLEIKAVRDKNSYINRNKGISPLLPPIAHTYNHQKSHISGPVRSNPDIGQSNIEQIAAMKKTKTMFKKGKKSKGRRYSDVHDKTTTCASNPYNRVDSMDWKRTQQKPPSKFEVVKNCLPVHDITFKSTAPNLSTLKMIKRGNTANTQKTHKASRPYVGTTAKLYDTRSGKLFKRFTWIST